MAQGQIRSDRAADPAPAPDTDGSPLDGARLRGVIDALETLHLAALLLDRTGRAIHVSARARGLLGQDLRLVRGRPSVLNDQRAAAALNDGIAATRCRGMRSDDPTPARVTIERAGRRPLILTVRPLRGAKPGRLGGAGTILTIDDLDETATLATDVLKRLYGLTTREVELCEALLSGRSVAASATRLGMSLSTARTHLKHVLCKTRTARQSVLLTLLTRHRCG